MKNYFQTFLKISKITIVLISGYVLIISLKSSVLSISHQRINYGLLLYGHNFQLCLRLILPLIGCLLIVKLSKFRFFKIASLVSLGLIFLSIGYLKLKTHTTGGMTMTKVNQRKNFAEIDTKDESNQYIVRSYLFLCRRDFYGTKRDSGNYIIIDQHPWRKSKKDEFKFERSKQ